MNNRRIMCIVLVLYVAVALSAEQNTKDAAKESCWKTAKAQTELNECAAGDERKEDAESNRLYSALLKRLRDDPVALESLKESERAWLNYRDAQMKASHPHSGDEGSVRPMCVSSQTAGLTTQRAEMLRKMLRPVEGDVCSYQEK